MHRDYDVLASCSPYIAGYRANAVLIALEINLKGTHGTNDADENYTDSGCALVAILPIR